MCGIVGILDPERRLGVTGLQDVARAMAAELVHRGPDDHGVWVSSDGLCALAHRRLTIIDPSSAGRQPMLDLARRLAVSFNGEIYNYRELREELRACGRRFSTQTDTEVLLEALGEFGEAAYPKLEGMYALALFDTEHRQLTLARDPFGEKPLYYTTQGGALAFASELNAFRAVPWFEPLVNPDGLAQYLALRYVPSPATIYRETFKVEPGAWIRADARGQLRHGRHFVFSPASAERGRDKRELLEELSAAVTSSVRRCMISDFPLGSFLSGGVDSSLVTAVAQELADHPLRTFSIGFAGAQESEHVAAAGTAARLGCQHSNRILSARELDLLPVITAAMDEPNADPSCLPTYVLSGLARERVKVALSGDGGDELFGGYETYIQMVERAARSTGSHFRAGDAFLRMMMAFSRAEVAELIGGLPPGTSEVLSRIEVLVDTNDRPLVSRMRLTDSQSFLPGSVLSKVDRMSMAHSLEVRCPLLNRRIAGIASRLGPEDCVSNGSGKPILRRLAARYLPPEWMNRPKTGFGLPHSWLSRDAVRTLVREHLTGRAKLSAWIGPKELERFVKRQDSELTSSLSQAWVLLVLELWLQSHPEARPDSLGALRDALPMAQAAAPPLALLRLIPRGTEVGVGFNLQDDGSSALAVSCTNAGAWTNVVFDGRDLGTTFGTATELTALVPAELYAAAGCHEVWLVDGDRRSESLVFEVWSAPWQEALLLRALSPNSIVAGIGFNVQPTGESALAVEAENAGPGTVVLIDGVELATHFGSPSFLSALVPAGSLERVGTHKVTLRDRDRTSNSLNLDVVTRPAEDRVQPDGR